MIPESPEALLPSIIADELVVAYRRFNKLRKPDEVRAALSGKSDSGWERIGRDLASVHPARLKPGVRRDLSRPYADAFHRAAVLLSEVMSQMPEGVPKSLEQAFGLAFFAAVAGIEAAEKIRPRHAARALAVVQPQFRRQVVAAIPLLRFTDEDPGA